ncbi:hypothetical protein PENSPDRAFT_31059 [Peniophora sp. CONT]|nr:hypothetical protein PENSPDRAFT_31059 [Peniophora sp. CONT]
MVLSPRKRGWGFMNAIGRPDLCHLLTTVSSYTLPFFSLASAARLSSPLRSRLFYNQLIVSPRLLLRCNQLSVSLHSNRADLAFQIFDRTHLSFVKASIFLRLIRREKKTSILRSGLVPALARSTPTS